MKIQYATGSRADFGLMKNTLKYLHSLPDFDVSVVATGQHFMPKYGSTINEVRTSGLVVASEIPVKLTGDDGFEMGFAFSDELRGFLESFSKNKPDMLLLLGDRGEMLAAAIAAIHCGICIGHLHGGEVSGTIDESFRHAISKLSHFHFVATADAAERLLKMGEHQKHIWEIGAPGLVNITAGIERNSSFLSQKYGVTSKTHSILCVFHPVVQEASKAAVQFNQILELLISQDCSGVILRPNSDAGGSKIEEILSRRSLELANRFAVIDHLPRQDYLTCLASVDLLVGNSSSGIIEAASFLTPNLCIGNRQSARLRSNNTVDCVSFDQVALTTAFNEAISLSRSKISNVYGNGKAHLLLADALKTIEISENSLSKQISY